MSEMTEKQALRDYLDWKNSLFLPLPAYLLENLKEVACLSQTLIQTIMFEKNAELFCDQKRTNLLQKLAEFLQSLTPKSGGENDITKLSAIAGDIMATFSEMDQFLKKGKLVLSEKFQAAFSQSFSAWNGILSQFRWIERTISAYLAQLELAEAPEPPQSEEVKESMYQILNAIPGPQEAF